MGLQENFLRGIYAYGFKKPYTIQKRGIVPFCRGLDVIEQAHPGTEKTAACCNGILQRLDYGLNQCQALVLTPRNDLALQTEKLMRALGKYLSVRVLACVGGASVHEDKFFKLVLLSLALPALYLTCFTGRHFAGIILRFSYWTRLMNCLLVVLKTSSGWLFSATMSPKCLVITRKFMNKPARIFQKPPDELNLEGWQWLADKMRHRNHAVSAIHADMDWDTFDAIVREFHAGSCRVHITDDFMVDCIDAPPPQQQESVIVVNYDLPDDLEDYVHRLGPSLRFRRKGHVICFGAREEERKLHDIQRFYNVDIKELYPHSI
ncbi:hypothetical protein ACFX13_047208 [Malus domestica]